MAIARVSDANIGWAVATGVSGSFDATGADYIIAYAQRNDTTVQTCSYAGAGMTLIGSTTGTRPIDVFFKLAPASGSNTIASSAATSTYRSLQVVAYSGVNQSLTYSGGSPTDAFTVTAGSSGTSKTTTITPLSSNSWIIGTYLNDNGGTETGSGTAVKIAQYGNAGSNDAVLDTNGTVATSSQNFGCSSTSSGNQSLFCCTISPAGGATFTPTPMLHMLQMAGGIV